MSRYFSFGDVNKIILWNLFRRMKFYLILIGLVDFDFDFDCLYFCLFLFKVQVPALSLFNLIYIFFFEDYLVCNHIFFFWFFCFWYWFELMLLIVFVLFAVSNPRVYAYDRSCWWLEILICSLNFIPFPLNVSYPCLVHFCLSFSKVSKVCMFDLLVV